MTVPYETQYGQTKPEPVTRQAIPEGPPYCWTDQNRYAHRIRAAWTMTASWGEWTSLLLWCGQGRSTRKHTSGTGDLPPDGYRMCSTCEGRAVGAGLGSSLIQVADGTELIFTPRRPRWCPGTDWIDPPLPSTNDRIVQCTTCGQLCLTSWSGGPYQGAVKLGKHRPVDPAGEVLP